MENREVAKILRETAQLLEIDGAIIGRYRTYEKVAELLFTMPERIEDIAKEPAKLRELPGVGENMAEHICEVLKTGDYSLRQKLLKKYPATLLEVLELQSLGAKKTAAPLQNIRCCYCGRRGKTRPRRKAARNSRLRRKERAEHSQGLRAVPLSCRRSARVQINVAEDAARLYTAYILKACAQVESVTPAGSLRRGRETVGDLDLLLTMKPGHDSQEEIDKVAEHLLRYPAIHQTLAHGENKVSVILDSKLQVDLRLLRKENFGAALMYFTGSKAHNVALRGRALDMGWTLNEYALTTLKTGKVVASKTEQEIYAKLKLAYIEPELRELRRDRSRRSRQAARPRQNSPTFAATCKCTLRPPTAKIPSSKWAKTGRDFGYEYIALTDHSKAVTVANGMDESAPLRKSKKSTPRSSASPAFACSPESNATS